MPRAVIIAVYLRIWLLVRHSVFFNFLMTTKFQCHFHSAPRVKYIQISTQKERGELSLDFGKINGLISELCENFLEKSKI